MNLNSVAAIADETSTTISARFSTRGDASRSYVFKVTRTLAGSLKEGDGVLVESQGAIKIAYVEGVHEFSEIDPSSEISYNWAFQKVRTEVLEKLKEREAKVVSKLEEHRRQQLRKQVLDSIGVNDIQGLFSPDGVPVAQPMAPKATEYPPAPAPTRPAVPMCPTSKMSIDDFS